jgi:hypothetical protein
VFQGKPAGLKYTGDVSGTIGNSRKRGVPPVPPVPGAQIRIAGIPDIDNDTARADSHHLVEGASNTVERREIEQRIQTGDHIKDTIPEGQMIEQSIGAPNPIIEPVQYVCEQFNRTIRAETSQIRAGCQGFEEQTVPTPHVEQPAAQRPATHDGLISYPLTQRSMK